MDFSVLNPVVIVTSLIVAATPLLFAALGELVVEKSGVLNLGVEGMMIVGAIAGFATTIESGSPWLGLCAAMLGGAVLALLFGVLTQVLMSNQVATGLMLSPQSVRMPQRRKHFSEATRRAQACPSLVSRDNDQDNNSDDVRRHGEVFTANRHADGLQIELQNGNATKQVCT